MWPIKWRVVGGDVTRRVGAAVRLGGSALRCDARFGWRGREGARAVGGAFSVEWPERERMSWRRMRGLFFDVPCAFPICRWGGGGGGWGVMGEDCTQLQESCHGHGHCHGVSSQCVLVTGSDGTGTAQATVVGGHSLHPRQRHGLRGLLSKSRASRPSR